MEFKIETGIPILGPRTRSDVGYVIESMQVGQSVLFDLGQYRRVNNAIYHNYRGQFTVRKVDSEHFRVWRIKEAND